MGLKVIKSVCPGLHPTQAQTSLRIHAVCSAPLLFAFWKKYQLATLLTWYRWNLNFLASLCSWGDWFETRFVGNPKDRFSRDEAHIMYTRWKVHACIITFNTFLCSRSLFSSISLVSSSSSTNSEYLNLNILSSSCKIAVSINNWASA